MIEKVYQLQVTGKHDTMSGKFRASSQKVFVSRAMAEAEIPAFLARCADPIHVFTLDVSTAKVVIVELTVISDSETEA